MNFPQGCAFVLMGTVGSVLVFALLGTLLEWVFP
jgi:hypothetical protein